MNQISGPVPNKSIQDLMAGWMESRWDSLVDELVFCKKPLIAFETGAAVFMLAKANHSLALFMLPAFSVLNWHVHLQNSSFFPA